MLVPESDDSPVEVPEVESFVVEPEELEPELVPESVPESVLEESEPSVDDEPPSVVPVLESDEPLVPDVLSEVLPEVLSLPLVVG